MLDALATAGVREFDRYRAPLSPDDLARRRKAQLTPRQDELLAKWGYPYVLEEFRFHMTLTARITGLETMASVRQAADRHFAAALAQPVWFDTIGLFVERDPGGPFTVLSAVSLAAETPSTARACLPA